MRKNKRVMSIIAIVLALVMVAGIVVSLVMYATAASAASVTEMESQKAAAQQELESLKSEQGDITAERTELQNTVNSLKSESATYTQQKEALDQKVDLTLKEITNIEDQINTYGALITEKEAELQAAEDEQAYQLERYETRLRSMEEDGNLTYLSVLFSARNFSDLITKIYDIQEIMDYDRMVADELEQATIAVKEAKEQLEATKIELEDSKTELESAKTQLEAEVSEAQAVITELNANISESQEEIDALAADQDRVDAEINSATQDVSELDSSIQTAIAGQKAAAEKAAAEAASAAAARAAAAASAATSGSSSSSTSSSSSSSSGSTSASTATAVSGTGMFNWPSATRTVTSNYGYRVNPVTGVYKLHAGADIGAPMGSAILAAAGGQVVTAEYSSSYGNYVLINHGGGYYTLYAHASALCVSAGQTVCQGQTIAKVGSTGNSTGPHLHFEIRVNGSTVNPLSFF